MRAARTATLLLALLPALSWAQQTAPAPSQETGGQAASSEEAVTSKVPLEDIRRFVAVYNAVRAAYVDPVDDKKLMQAAVRGLLLDLDPHSTYFNKEDAQAFDEQASGAYEGIGVELQQQPDNASMKVISPIDDTPAAKAGILAGDLIIAIDGKPISAIDASEPLRGPAGSKVVLTIVREGKPKPFDVSLTRQTIRVTSVRSRLLEPGYGYIRLSTFQADTGSDFQKHVQQLQKQSGGQLKGLVLDLRNEETIYAVNRFVIYALYPQCNISIHVMWGVKQQNTVFAIGKSIIDRSSQTNVGELCLSYSGGGHANAGTCQVANEEAEAALRELIAEITADG